MEFLIGILLGGLAYILINQKKLLTKTPTILKEDNKQQTNKSSNSMFDNFNKSNTNYQNKQKEEKDNFEGWFYEEANDTFKIHRVLKIKYIDGKGNQTERVIDTIKYGTTYNGGMILAYCRYRKKGRSFYTNRIQECIDYETGEVIRDIDSYFRNSPELKAIKEEIIQKEERAKYLEELTAYRKQFIEKYNLLLKVLMYIVKCDGTFNKKERAIIREIFESLEENPLFTESFLDNILVEYYQITERAFKINVKKLIENNPYRGIDILEITQNIVSTQKTIHRNEKEVLDYITKIYGL